MDSNEYRTLTSQIDECIQHIETIKRKREQFIMELLNYDSSLEHNSKTMKALLMVLKSLSEKRDALVTVKIDSDNDPI